MNVEYTGRQYEITPKVRKQVDHGLAKLVKILGDNFESKVVLAVEKHRCKAEITVTVRSNPIVGLAEAGDMIAAVGEALERIERQAIKHRTRWRLHRRPGGRALIPCPGAPPARAYRALHRTRRHPPHDPLGGRQGSPFP